MTNPEPAPTRPIWMRPKVIIVALAAIILLIVILQNLEPVTTKILFLEMTMPQAILIAAVAAIAFLVGVITDGRVLRRGKDKPEA